ncbi:MAG: SdrD B-like domain-containing protein [Pseudomonadota bacterium]
MPEVTYSNQTQIFEFTAFTEADLLQGTNGNSIGNCDSFTMPGSATVCFSVTDNDTTLSGDRYYNESGDDRSFQTADITVDGSQIFDDVKIYAEQYHVLHGSDGKTYYLIEIEVKNGDAPGQGDDFFTFYGDVPPAGIDLHVVGTHNVTSNWMDYKCLSAGLKWDLDDDCAYTIEAEDMELWNYRAQNNDAASGDALIKLKGHQGTAKVDFGGEAGKYDLEIAYVDENDGQGFIDVFINGQFVACISLDDDDNGNGVHNTTFSTFKLSGVEFNPGDEIKLKGRMDDYEFARIDKITFTQVKEPEFRECDDPDAVLIDFNDLNAGDVVGMQFEGVMISAQRAGDDPTSENDAMIFDSSNPTGGDNDLATANQGNLLIISEDNDSSDPDDNIGGTIEFKFDRPSFIYDLKVIDTEEGGTIDLFDADGNLLNSVAIPQIGDGDIAQVLLDTDGVSRMVVTLNGSGAVDDLCYVPGEPQPGALSGTYFCDVDRDGVDDGAANGDADVAGKLVTLFFADGTRATDIAGNLLEPVQTDAQGNYRFDNLAAGDYVVMFEDSAAEGKRFVAPNSANGDDTNDSDVVDLTTGKTAPVTVNEGEETENVDAGVEALPGALSGTYFCDENDNDINDSGDSPVAGKLVTLFFADGTPATDIDGTPIAAVLTDDNGDYAFTNLAAGEYVVMFEDSIAEGKDFVAPDSTTGDDTNDSDVVDLVNGKTAPVTVVAGETTENIDAGVEEPDPMTGQIGDTVWLDLFGDGILNDEDFDPFFSGREEGVEGVTVQLKDATTGTVLKEQLTDSDGNYLFTGLAGGDYIVGFVLPSGFEFTTQDAGGDDARDSDADRTSGMTDVITLEPGGSILTVDAGLLRCGQIVGTSQAEENSPVGGYDLLVGCETDDTIFGRSGEDKLIGNGGNDEIDGGSFDDTLDGGAGNDTLDGGSENDILIGGIGDDDIDGGDEVDIAVFSGNFTDSIINIFNIFTGELQVIGVDGTDRVRNIEMLRFDDGDVAVDALIPGGSRDEVTAPTGSGGTVNIDVLANDIGVGEGTLEVAEVNNGGFGSVVIEGDGTVSYTAGANFAGYDFFNYTVSNGLGFVRTVEVQIGELPALDPFDPSVVIIPDTIGVDRNIVDGTNSDDKILGGAGFDRIDSGNGNDTVDGGRGDDLLIGDRDTDLLLGGEGDDRLQSGRGSDLLFGEVGDDELLGESSNDIMFGGDGNDDFRGQAGSDFISGGLGNDTIINLVDGADIALGGGGDDVFLWNEASDAGERDLIDGESGVDSVSIELNAGIADAVAVQAEIDAYLAIVAANTPAPGTINDGSVLTGTFSFTTIDLDIRNVEDVFIA